MSCMVREDVWIDRHHINVLYEVLLRLSNNGSTPVEEQQLMDQLRREGYDFSRRDIVKMLMTLEILGKIWVESGGPRHEFRIKVYT